MFRYITGRLTEKTPNFAVIDVGGIGFKIFTSQVSLSDPTCISGAQVTFYTYMYIKEGIMDLYGFSTKEELSMFEMLISVSGVGAKGALAVLSILPPSKLALCIVTNDCNEIKKASGIGAKTAQRICLELKDKIKNESLVSGNTDAYAAISDAADSDSRKDAVSALVVLGYSSADAQKAVAKVDAAVENVESIIKQALKNLL